MSESEDTKISSDSNDEVTNDNSIQETDTKKTVISRATPTKLEVISKATELPTHPGRSLTAGNLANSIVNTFCTSIYICLVFTIGVKVLDSVIYWKTLSTISNSTQTEDYRNLSDEKIIDLTKEKIASNAEAIKMLEKINEKNHLADAWELFKNFGAIMAGPLGFVLGFYFRE
jgi:hypothetical protein